MDQLIEAIVHLVPEKYRPAALALLILTPRGIYAWLKPSATFKDALAAMFLGTNTPAQPAAAPAGPSQPQPGSKLPLIALLGALALGLSAGCGTPAAYKAVSTAQVSVETAMNAWHDYLDMMDQAGTPVPDATRAKVRDAYVKYQTAAAAVVQAERALGTLTATNNPTDVSDAQGRYTAAAAQAGQALTDLVSLLQQIGVKI